MNFLNLFLYPPFVMLMLGFASCSSKNNQEDHALVSESYILEKLQRIDRKFQTIKENSTLINCQLYKKGCRKVFRASLLKYEIFVVEMESRELATREAQRVQGLSYENWLFDNIQKELPLIEKLQEAFGPNAKETNGKKTTGH